MNNQRSEKRTISGRRRNLVLAVTLIAAAIAVPVCHSQTSPTEKKDPPSNWPEKPPFNVVIDAFTATLTRAGWDGAFRDRLKQDCTSARAAVAEEGNITVPDTKVIIFYEPQAPASAASKIAAQQDPASRALLAWHSKSNENYHVFYLPPFKQDDKTKTYLYIDYIKCCYDYWRPSAE